MVVVGTEVGEEATVAVGRTVATMSLNSSTSSETYGGRSLRVVLVLSTDGEINISGYTPHRAAQERALSLPTTKGIRVICQGWYAPTW